MKKYLLALLVICTLSCWAFAQDGGNATYQTNGSGAGVTVRAIRKLPETPVQGAPYSATMTNTSTQMLADGNRIVQTSSGTVARDSLGRTRQDAPLPSIGNLSAANAPHLVFLQDPVSQTSFTLDLTNKTARKMPSLPLLLPPGSQVPDAPMPGGPGGAAGVVSIQMGMAGPMPPPMDAGIDAGRGGPPVFFLQRGPIPNDQGLAAEQIRGQVGSQASSQGNVATQDLGSQMMEGVLVNGTRTTFTIPAGQIGNDRAIDIVTEVWTSPDLKTVVYSKRTDPRMGEQTFQLTNIVRGEPDASLFIVPADFKIAEGPQPIIYRPVQ